MNPRDFWLYIRDTANPQIRVRLLRAVTLPLPPGGELQEVQWTGYVPNVMTVRAKSVDVGLRTASVSGAAVFQRAVNPRPDGIAGYALELLRPTQAPFRFHVQQFPYARSVSGEVVVLRVDYTLHLYPGDTGELPLAG